MREIRFVAGSFRFIWQSARASSARCTSALFIESPSESSRYRIWIRLSMLSREFTFAWYMLIWAASYFIFLVLIFRERWRVDSFSAVSRPGCLFMISRIYSICFCFWWTRTSFSTTCSVLKMSLFCRVLIFSFISYESGSVPSRFRHRWIFSGF